MGVLLGIPLEALRSYSGLMVNIRAVRETLHYGSSAHRGEIVDEDNLAHLPDSNALRRGLIFT